MVTETHNEPAVATHSDTGSHRHGLIGATR
jgi:heavy metal efflux system protein